jgi:glycosyltransferase involved in cell wall biosynthesis
MIVTNADSGGGAERSMNVLSDSLKEKIGSVSIVAINASPEDSFHTRAESFQLGRRWKGSFRETLRAFNQFRRVVKSWQPNLIILNCSLPELFGALLPGRFNLIGVEHARIPWENHKFLGRAVREILKIRGTRWIAVSEHLKIWPSEELPSAVIQNSIITSTKKSQVSNIEKLTHLYFLGRLSIEKCPEILLDLSQILRTRVEIFGDGNLREILEEDSLKRNLDVHFHGYVERPWEQIQPGGILVVPSSSEGDGLVVIEAIINKVPIILADIPEFRRFDFPEVNYCKDLIGFTTRISDFREKILDLIISEETANMIVESRDPSKIASQWKDFLENQPSI